MANPETSSSQARRGTTAAPLTGMAVLGPAIGWLIPGAGHLIQKRLIRGLLLMASVVTMFALGLAMNGKIYKPNTGDLLDILGFVGDLGAGGLYILGRAFDWGGSAISYATAHYGTQFIVLARLLTPFPFLDAT